MGKILLVLLVIGVIVWATRRPVRGPRGSTASAPPQPPARELSVMVRCARCGLHLPRAESYPGRGGDYCSEAHRSEQERGQDS